MHWLAAKIPSYEQSIACESSGWSSEYKLWYTTYSRCFSVLSNQHTQGQRQSQKNSKTDALPYYLSKSRYSPANGGRTNDSMGFGSKAPRFPRGMYVEYRYSKSCHNICFRQSPLHWWKSRAWAPAYTIMNHNMQFPRRIQVLVGWAS